MTNLDDQMHLEGSDLRDAQRCALETYYRETNFDYCAIWRSNLTRARHFGFHYRGPFDHHRAVARASAELAESAGVAKGTRVLDCGCGLGGTALWLARNRGALVAGIDLLDHQVESAKAAALQRGLASRANFVCGDAADTGLPDGSFDVVLIQEALCHLPDKSAFYAEARRLLAPGGRLVVAEYMRTSRVVSAEAENTLRRWCEGWAMPGLWTTDEHTEAARRSGFGQTLIVDESDAVEASLRLLYRNCLVFGPLNYLLHAVGLRSDVTQANISASRLQYEAFRDGLWIYGKLTALAET